MPVQLVYATFPDTDSAQALGRRCLEAGLAACFTHWQAGTQYRWEGEIVEDEETLVLFKTAPERREELVSFLEDEHPYDVPCLLPIDSEEANPAYAEWIADEATA
jgi:periplasmic divalent cation tolerance protein